MWYHITPLKYTKYLCLELINFFNIHTLKYKVDILFFQ